MKRVIELLLVLLSAVLLPAGLACNTVDGLWQGKIKQNNREYRIVLRIGSTSSLDSPDTGKLGIPILSVSNEHNSLSFVLDDLKISFRGKLSEDQSKLVGEWTQGNAKSEISLTRLTQAPQFDKDGPYLFSSNCASCHAPFNPVRAPWPQNLQLMTEQAILRALETGKMRAQDAIMTHEQRVVLASYLGRHRARNPVRRMHAQQINLQERAVPFGTDGEWIYSIAAFNRMRSPDSQRLRWPSCA